MAHRSRKAKRNGPTFVALFHYMLDSAGYRALSMTGRAALVEVASLYHGDNNGRLVAPVRWLADRLGTGKSTAARALLELEEKGFIETVKLGSFTRHNRTAAEYRLTFHHCDVDHRLPSKRFIKGAPTYGVDVDSVPPMGPSASPVGPWNAVWIGPLPPVGRLRMISYDCFSTSRRI